MYKSGLDTFLKELGFIGDMTSLFNFDTKNCLKISSQGPEGQQSIYDVRIGIRIMYMRFCLGLPDLEIAYELSKKI